ncbi:MAG TPA: exo-alpha-sialidase, partial [bacterium (Candidatus Stahlbacteria)]|nr:exo-alpha-sialidase [Candidatus Stahlbacteria bacterium]
MLKEARFFWGLLIPITWWQLLALPPQGWDSPQRFPSSVNHQYPGLAAADRYLYQGFLSGDEGGYELYLRRSTTVGFHWYDPIQISQAASHNGFVSKDQFDIATSSDGSLVYLVWTEIAPSDTALWFSYSTNYGVSWTTPDRINDDLGLPYEAVQEFYPAVWCDNADILHLAFYYRWDNTATDVRLCYSQFNPLSGWIQYEIIADDVLGWHVFDITTLNDTPHVLYKKEVQDAPRFWHAERVGVNQWNKNFALESGASSLLRLVADGAGYLHLLFHRKYGWPHIVEKIFYSYSSDHGQSWLNPEKIGPQSGQSHECDLAVNPDGIHAVYTDFLNFTVCYRRKSSPGGLWDDEIIIAQYSDSLCASSAIADNSYGLHVSYYTYPVSSPLSNFIHYLAHRNGLYSGSPGATAANGPRHLVRQPGSENLYLVYQTEFEPCVGYQYGRNWIYFATSGDGGQTWSPYTWLNYGKDPGIAYKYAPIPSLPEYLALTYLSEDNKKILYRWFDLETGVWSDPFVVYDNPSDNYLDPPAVTAVEDTAFILFAERSETESWIKCAWFKFDEITPILFDTVRWRDIPHYLYSPSVYHDGNRDLHAVWQEGNIDNPPMNIY